MKNRLFTLLSAPQFGLIGWLEQTRVHLPLKGVECSFHVCGDLLNVQIDQVFHQSAAKALDCIYTFPLPATAAVYRCEMLVNGRVVRAKVEEQARAREIAREQKAAGRRTALVELERENLFTLTLGNLQPGDVVIIRLAYFETLTRLADWTSLRIPFCPGVRYITGKPLLRSLRGKGVQDDTDEVPDASRLSPPRIDALHPDAAYLSVEGVIENALGVASDLSSPSHPVLVRDGDGRFTVTLADQSAVPDCDFALRWTESPIEQMKSAAWVTRDGAESYALVFLQAPQIAAPTREGAQDYYFMVDRSSSMEGIKWIKAVQAFRAFLNHLGPGDRAWATFFNSQWQDFAEKPLSPAELMEDPGLSKLELLGAHGGTELLPALKHSLEVLKRHSAGRRASLILITDGQMGNEEHILESLRVHPDVRLHAFGIDTAVNDALLTRLASQQRGSCCMMQPQDDIVGAVTRVGSRLRQPVLTSISAGRGCETPGASIPDLHSSECLSLALKLNSQNATEVVIKGKLPDGSKQTLRFTLVERTEPAIRLLWAKGRISRHLTQGQRDEALTLAKQHNLLCEGAAFIAWDEAEQVVIAEEELYQPCEETRFLYASAPVSIFDCYMAPKRERVQATPYRRRGHHGKSLLLVANDQLQAILNKRKDLDGARFLQEFAPRLGQWYARFTESYAFPRASSGDHMAGLLMEWVVDGAAEAPPRMKSLEALADMLEHHGATAVLAHRVLRVWLGHALAQNGPLRQELLAALRGVVRNIEERASRSKV